MQHLSEITFQKQEITCSEHKYNWCVQGSKEQQQTRPEVARSKVTCCLQSLQSARGSYRSLEDTGDHLDTH